MRDVELSGFRNSLLSHKNLQEKVSSRGDKRDRCLRVGWASTFLRPFFWHASRSTDSDLSMPQHIKWKADGDEQSWKAFTYS